MASRHDTLVENQKGFRHANERLQDVVRDAVGVDGRSVPFLCECAQETCHGRIEATVEEYEDAHFNRDDYFILRGHTRVTGEEIIAEIDGYEVVRKESVIH